MLLYKNNMKGEFRDDNNNKTQAPHPNMFSKFHPHPHHHQPPPQPPPPQHFAHQFQLSNTSEEADSRSRSPSHVIGPGVGVKKDANNDGASIEVVKRPRGRPPGSKNKPKPPVIITREADPAMSPYVLELPGATDIIDAINKYCKKRNTGLCILTGSGTVSNVSLRQPTATTTGGTVTFHGRFDILSLSATVLPSGSGHVAAFANGFTISLAGPQGQIVGGAVAGPLVSAGPVYIIAASFNNPMYHRLPSEDETSGGASGSVDAGGERSSPPAGTGSAGGGEHPHQLQHHHQPPSTTAADTMSMYSSHLPSDVIWAPTARQPY